MKKINIVHDEEEPIAVEVMAQAIKDISEGIKKLQSGPLNDYALLLLIQNATARKKKGRWSTSAKISTKTIKDVLDGIENLEATYLK